MQQTIAQNITVEGIGLHSGVAVKMCIMPAPAGHGIVFKRTDVPRNMGLVPARWDSVIDTQLCTVIGNKSGTSVKTIEHLMSALRGCNIDNALIEINAPEVPVMDGSALTFVEKIKEAGICRQDKPRYAIRILKEVHIEDAGCRAAFFPTDSCSENNLDEQRFISHIDFDHDVIGKQSFSFDLAKQNYHHDIAKARTFGFVEDVEKLQKMGLAQGASLENAVPLTANGIIGKNGDECENPYDALRYRDEFSRHKVLDAIGDIALAGMPIIGAYESFRGGHRLNNLALHQMFADKQAYELVPMPVRADKTNHCDDGKTIFIRKPAALARALA